MGLLIGLLFRKILFWLLITLGFSLVRMLFTTGLKKSVDVQMGWTPKIPGEYILKLYVMDGMMEKQVLKTNMI